MIALHACLSCINNNALALSWGERMPLLASLAFILLFRFSTFRCGPEGSSQLGLQGRRYQMHLLSPPPGHLLGHMEERRGK